MNRPVTPWHAPLRRRAVSRLREARSPLARTERLLRRRARALRRWSGDRHGVEHYVDALETAADLHVTRLSSQRNRVAHGRWHDLSRQQTKILLARVEMILRDIAGRR